MIDIDTWILEYSAYFEQIEYSKTNSTISLYFPDIEYPLTLNIKQIELLKSGRIPKIKNFSYYNEYGFQYLGYAEIFISFTNWFTNIVDLKFKIGNSIFELSEYSNYTYILFTDYFENISELYRDNGFNNDGNFSLKIYNSNKDELNSNIEKALYYLNSYYIRDINNSVKISNLPIGNYDDFSFNDSNVTRKRVRTRKDINDIIPLKLYNYAVTQNSDSRFLSFYRVIEYYFPLITEKKIQELRFTKAISNSKFLSSIRDLNTEKGALKVLIENVLTFNESKYLINILEKNSIIDKNCSSSLFTLLYDFRCSIVHSKSTLKGNIVIPDPLEVNNTIDIWAGVGKYIAEKSINKLSS